jgi:hypothetical protein
VLGRAGLYAAVDQGKFSFVILAAAYLLYLSSKDLLSTANLHQNTQVAYSSLLTVWLTVYIVLLLKNPGAKSQSKVIKYVEETLYAPVTQCLHIVQLDREL